MMLVSRSLMLMALCLFIAGCGGGEVAETPPAAETELGDAGSLEPSEPMETSGEEPAGSAETPTAAPGTIALSPDNTQIQFIGTHAGDDPNPRTGEFTEFSGAATLGDNGGINAVKVEIQTASLTTPIENLTNHLKSPDFLDVREHPTIVFETTNISVGDEQMTFNGNLTLMGTTKEVSIPAQVSVTDGRLSLTASLKINRSEFGMDGSLDRVNDEVEINVAVEEAG